MCARACTRPVRRPRPKRWSVARASVCAMCANRGQGIYHGLVKLIKHRPMRRTRSSSTLDPRYVCVDLAERNKTSPGCPIDSQRPLSNVQCKVCKHLHGYMCSMCSYCTLLSIALYHSRGVALILGVHARHVVERIATREAFFLLYSISLSRHCACSSRPPCPSCCHGHVRPLLRTSR